MFCAIFLITIVHSYLLRIGTSNLNYRLNLIVKCVNVFGGMRIGNELLVFIYN